MTYRQSTLKPDCTATSSFVALGAEIDRLANIPAIAA